MQLLKHVANAMQRAESFVLERALVVIINTTHINVHVFAAFREEANGGVRFAILYMYNIIVCNYLTMMPRPGNLFW